MLNLKHYVTSLILPSRQFSITQNLLRKNHYDTLGITPSATLNEIKKAYYNLSMMYHPDKSNGSDEALHKFRALTEAYEVLSNLNSKRLYDKGVLRHSALRSDKQPVARTQTVVIPNPSTMPIYNFDKWSREHYAEKITKRASAKQKFEEIQFRKAADITEDKLLIFLFSLFIFISFAWLVVELNTPNLDVPVKKKQD